MNHWILGPDGRTPMKVELADWATWFETANRQVARDEAEGITVSTVFLGIDYSLSGVHPLLFETMVFGGPFNGEEERHATWDEALAYHRRIAAIAFAAHDMKIEKEAV